MSDVPWDFTYPGKIGDTGFARNLTYVRDVHGRSFAQQVDDFKTLSQGPGKLLFPDYYRYGLYRQLNNGDRESALEFVGKRQQWALAKAEGNVANINPLLFNKRHVEKVLKAAGVSTLDTLVTYRSRGDTKQLLSWLKDAQNYPFFGKPVRGRQSGGVCLAECIDAGQIHMRDGGTIAPERFIQGMNRHVKGWRGRQQDGYLIQRVETNDRLIKPLVGLTLATFRVVFFKTDNGFELRHCVWKMPLGEQVADNHWRGSALAGVDVETGTIVKMSRGSGRRRQELTHHPDTKALLAGIAVPDWSTIKSFASGLCALFPEVDIQSWDVCLTDAGLKVVEFNPGGDIGLVQMAYDRGVLSAEYLNLLRLKAETRVDTKRFLKTFGQSLSVENRGWN